MFRGGGTNKRNSTYTSLADVKEWPAVHPTVCWSACTLQCSRRQVNTLPSPPVLWSTLPASQCYGAEHSIPGILLEPWSRAGFGYPAGRWWARALLPSWSVNKRAALFAVGKVTDWPFSARLVQIQDDIYYIFLCWVTSPPTRNVSHQKCNFFIVHLGCRKNRQLVSSEGGSLPERA